MALSEEERSRLEALERSLMSSSARDDSDMPEIERSARPDSQDPFAFLTGGHPGRRAGADPFAEQASGARRVSLRSSGRATPARIAVVLALGLAGLALYAVAVWSQIPWFGAGGFVLWILAVAWWLRPPSPSGAGGSAPRGRGQKPGRPGPTGRGPSGNAGPRRSGARRTEQGDDGSFMQRLEGRWDARRNDRDA